MTGRQKLKFKQQETAHEMELALDSFYSTLEPLEECIGKAGYYSDWNNRRQIYRKVIKDSDDTLEGFEDLFLTDLFCFKGQVRKKDNDFMKKIKIEFYKWIDATGINLNNCPEKLKHFLYEINEVLEGRGEKIVNQTRELVRDTEPTPKEALGMFGQLNHLLNKGRERAEVLESKKWNDELENEERINGNPDRGKEILKQICQEVAPRHGDFDLYSEQKKVRGIQEVRWDLIMEIDQNKDYWEIRKNIAITYDRYGREKKGDILIIKTARLNNRDYNQATGELINQPGKVYRQDYFNDKELAEINAIFTVSVPVNQQLVNEIKQNAKLEKELFVINRKTGERFEGDDWFIHNSLEKREFDNKTGHLIYVPNLMVRAKDLSEAEQKEVGYKSETSHQVQSQNRPSGGKGGWGSSYMWGSFSVISLIGLAFTR